MVLLLLLLLLTLSGMAPLAHAPTGLQFTLMGESGRGRAGLPQRRAQGCS